MSEQGFEFKDFLSSVPSEVPATLSANILKRVKKDLRPSQQAVFFKLSVVQLFSAALTLVFCPQFGLGPLGGSHGVMGYFMVLGPAFCAIGCGGFFLGTTALVSQFILSREEQRAVYEHRFSHFSLLGALSFAVMMCLNRVVSGSWTAETLDFVFSWLAAGTLAATLIFTLGYRLRRLIQSI